MFKIVKREMKYQLKYQVLRSGLACYITISLNFFMEGKIGLCSFSGSLVTCTFCQESTKSSEVVWHATKLSVLIFSRKEK